MKILVLNSGSSSLKYQLIDMQTEQPIAKGNFERIGQDNSFLTHKKGEEKHVFEHPVENHDQAIQFVLDKLIDSQVGVIQQLDEIDAIGHRIVHGGEYFNHSVLVDDDVISKISECSTLAPLHNPAAVLGIMACKKLMPTKKMVVVFDTAFHQTMPKEHYMYPIPYQYYEKHKIRRYGFHGTSHLYVSNRVAEIIGKPVQELKIVSCHLGQGASLCAIQDGKSQDTTMGLTPLGGIPMGARSGDIDPSIITYLMEKENFTPTEINTILNKESGVYGLSGISPDFRDIEAEVANGNERAVLALSNYKYLVAQNIAKYAVTMQGIDVIVFTAGVGENQKNIRKGICDNLEFMGVKIDLDKNQIRGEEMEISTPDSKIRVFIVPTNEELVIARDTMKLVQE